MKYSEYIEKLSAIRVLAEQKQKGSPAVHARKLRLTERTFLRMVQQLRDSGLELYYNRRNNCYEIISESEKNQS